MFTTVSIFARMSDSFVNICRGIQVTKNLRYQLLFTAILSCFLLGFSCDKPTEPVPVKDYVFYFNDASYFDRYFRYHSATKRVDTLNIPYNSRAGFAVSADGSRLYLSDGIKTVVMTSDSFQVIAEIPYGGGVSVSPDNRFVAIVGIGIVMLSTKDYSLVFSDSIPVMRGKFSRDSRTFYCISSPNVIKVDIGNSTFDLTAKFFAGAALRWIIPSVDENKWILYRQFQTFGYLFEVYDVAQDSIVYQELLSPGAGDIEVTPDGRYVFYTNPGTLLFGPPPGPLAVFDIERNSVIDTILTPSPVNGFMVPRNLCITPDGRKLVVIGARGYGEFSVIDVRKLEVIEHYYLGNNVDIWDVVCQNGL